jgi:ribulose-phosphate 3-epimerase
MTTARKQLTGLDTHRIMLAPSLLAADFSRLAEEVRASETAGAEVLHLDIMDGHFVPNISFGADIVKALRGVSNQIFDVHLMISEPGRYLERFVAAGADHITFHVEVEEDKGTVLDAIHAADCTAGLSLRPGTPWEALTPWMDRLDLVLVMTVEPGFGGQAFRADQLPKIKAFRQAADASGRHIHIEVDGGIAPDTAPLVREAGANILVAGSSVFRAPGRDYAAAVAAMR